MIKAAGSGESPNELRRPKLGLMSRGFRNADSTQDLSEKATADRINEILERDREQAAVAEERRAHGGYGICENCGRPIGEERMAALPTATRCIACQSSWEQSTRL